MEELDRKELKAFINQKKNIVIYGAGVLGQGLFCILRKMELDNNICGFMVSEHADHMNDFMGVPIKCVSEFELDEVAVIVAVKEKFLDDIEKNLQDVSEKKYVGIKTLKELLQYEKLDISESMKETAEHMNLPDEEYVTFFIRQIRRTRLDFEINLVDHCNLNCKCCNHFSPIATPFFLKLEDFERDMSRIAYLTAGNVGRIWLIGGEPLLHPDIIAFLYSARKFFPDTHITLDTNGTLLLRQKEEFWKALRDTKIELTLTKYPIAVDYALIDKKMQEENVKYFYTLSSMVLKTTYHLPLVENGNLDGVENYIRCWHANECITVRAGRVYTCPIAAHAHYFNEYFGKNLYVGDKNSISLYEVESEKEILDFLKKPIPFCRHCNIAEYTYDLEWGISKREISEWI